MRKYIRLRAFVLQNLECTIHGALVAMSLQTLKQMDYKTHQQVVFKKFLKNVFILMYYLISSSLC